jgi:hypothetical protein
MTTAIKVVSHAKIIMSQAWRFRAGSKNGGKNGESCAGCCSNHGPIALKKRRHRRWHICYDPYKRKKGLVLAFRPKS